jgi:hypothetical protein
MQRRTSFLLTIVLMSLLGLSVIPALAAPSIKVTAAWRPTSQLTSIDVDADGMTDAGDDIRYVTADIYATVNVEFWAVDFVCTVNKAVLETYTQNGDPNSSEDDVAMFSVGTAWTYTVQLQNGNTVDTNGSLSFVISNIGDITPTMGSNGVTEVLHMATLKYRVREDLLAAGTSPLQCTSRFLNRDGRVVVVPTYTAPAPLGIVTGYTLNGNVKYQGITTTPGAAQAIEVQCDNNDADFVFDDVLTTANVTTGNFSVSNLRSQGRYDCNFIPHILNLGSAVPDAIHLTAQTDFNLTTSAFTLLPTLLKNGNMGTFVGTVNDIDSADAVTVTSNWNAPMNVLSSPYMFGDATGDRKIDAMDLALVSANLGNAEPYSAQHMIYSVPRDATLAFNNHLWLGRPGTSAVGSFGPANSRDYWPAVSPDNTRIVFVRNVGTGAADKFALFVAPITNGMIGAATRISPTTAAYDAFAPSWSPDGSRLAFVCSYDQAWKDLVTPYGALCVIDANGQNLVGPSNAVKLQAPAWLSSQNILFAGGGTIGNCVDNLCLINIQTGDLSLPANLAADIGLDMPYVRTTVLGLTLFYRNPMNNKIQFAQLNPATFAPFTAFGGAGSQTPGTIHERVETAFPNGSALQSVSGPINYYTISIGADPDIAFYGDGSIVETSYFAGSAGTPFWSSAIYTPLSEALNNPDAASGYAAAIPNTMVFLP